MEFMAFKEAFTYLLASGMLTKSFIFDRHSQITKWMREECPKKCGDLGKQVVKHFFDLWHIGKSKPYFLNKILPVTHPIINLLSTFGSQLHECLLFSLRHLNLYLSPEIQKILNKLSKEKSCEIISRWRKACARQFYWAVTSTQEHRGEVKLAMFQAFLQHDINKHKDLSNRLFNACAHGNITTPLVWMNKGAIKKLL